MRAAAYILLLVLAGPSVAHAACAWTCAHHQHPAAEASPPGACHEHEAEQEGPSLTSTDRACLETAETRSALVTSFTPFAADPAVRVPAFAWSPSASTPTLAARRTRLDPPDVLLFTTQLRV